MRRLHRVMIVGSAWTLMASLGASPSRAQGPSVADADPYRTTPYFAAPGLYGTSYGAPSYGITRTYSAFSSPFGLGYAYGHGYGANDAPYGLVPSRHGVGLWRPGLVTPGYVYGASDYKTFAVPGAPLPPPPIGLYAPGFGAPSPPSYEMR